MKILFIFNHKPYDGTDTIWNGLRLAERLLDNGKIVRIFIMNEAVDLAREACLRPPDYDNDLVKMLKELIAAGVPVKVCGTCITRCGEFKNHPYYKGAVKSNMSALADWVIDSDKIITF